ncbi:MAG: RNA-binding protein [Euryarchaeota archaeon]|nr:RNA-binding protein [Euryarchaeota archaeon]
MKVKSRHVAKHDDADAWRQRAEALFGEDAARLLEGKMEEAETDTRQRLVLCGGEPVLFFVENAVFATVRGALRMSTPRRCVVVDSGAVRFIANGADVMAPGVVEADPGVAEGDLVVVREQAHRKPLAVGRALMPGSGMKGSRGKAVKTLHYVGDRLWTVEL